MSYIDNLALKAENAGVRPLTISGNELTVLLDYIKQLAAGGGGGGTLAQTLALGNTTGGHDIDLTAGDNFVIKNNTSPDLKIVAGTYGADFIADGGGTIMTISTNTEEVIINGSTKQYGQLYLGIPSDVVGTVNFFNQSDNSGVILQSSSPKQLTIDNSGHDVAVGINGAPSGSYELEVNGGLLINGTTQLGQNDTRVLVTDNGSIQITSITDIEISVGADLIINGDTAVSGTFANPTSITIVNGIITAIS